MKQVFLKIGRTEIRNIIAIIYTLGVFGFLFVLAFHTVSEKNNNLLNVLGGVIIGGQATILGWFFGSSKNESDAAKNDITKVESTTKTTD